MKTWKIEIDENKTQREEEKKSVIVFLQIKQFEENTFWIIFTETVASSPF